jgi:hypothetical protein
VHREQPALAGREGDEDQDGPEYLDEVCHGSEFADAASSGTAEAGD